MPAYATPAGFDKYVRQCLPARTRCPDAARSYPGTSAAGQPRRAGRKGKTPPAGAAAIRQNERIVIEEKKKIRPGRSGSGIACRGKIPVFLEPDTPEMPAEKPLTERFKVLCRLIGGAVVHNHDFQPRRAVFRQADQALPGSVPSY